MIDIEFSFLLTQDFQTYKFFFKTNNNNYDIM
jgi:hypothetical protein